MFKSVAPKKSLRFDVVGQVLTAIFGGQLKAGDRLIVTRLAADFGVSATPAREALLELTHFGVVELLPNKGAVVRPLGPQQVREIYALRSLLESEATRLACGRIPSQQLEELRQRTSQLLAGGAVPQWSTQAHRSDLELHDLIARNCGNERLTDEIERYSRLVRVAQSVLVDAQTLEKLAQAQHLKILNALLAGQADAAANCMAEHIQSACEVLVAALFPKAELVN